MKIVKLLLLLMTLGLSTARGQATDRAPRIGYLYPAGGQQGTTFDIKVGGQYLQRTNRVVISGQGVHASVIQHLKPLSPKQQRLLRRELGRLRRVKGGGRGFFRPGGNFQKAKATTRPTTRPQTEEDVELPDHPLLNNLDNLSLEELGKVAEEFLSPKKQSNMQIAETVIVKVTIHPDAPPGERELRLITKTGLTNPLCFQVGTLPEVCEPDVLDSDNTGAAILDLPVAFNGQIRPGQIDRFKFRAQAGQHLVVITQARALIPYLADAVPGWFQATLALYDANGKELAAVDDYRFDPDPVLNYQISQNGDYALEIRDALYRGREDFVYRITVGELPFISHLFPMGGQLGVPTKAVLAGWNLPERTLPLDTKLGSLGIREVKMESAPYWSNRVLYAVDTLPESNEREPNDNPHKAQSVVLPQTLNGRIARMGDVDYYCFEGHAGERVVAQVLARRLGSALDSLLRLTDESGKVLAWNDDFPDNLTGLQTHAADSQLEVQLPKNGTFYVHVSDSQGHGGSEYGYRLRIGPPRPDFVLFATPSSLTVTAGGSTVFYIHAIRKEGFNGDVELKLKEAPAGFKLEGAHLDGRYDHIRITLTAPSEPSGKLVPLQLQGCAVIAGKTVTRPVIAAEDMMQAFAYRHRVPSREMTALVLPAKRFAPALNRVGQGRLQIPAGGQVELQINVRNKTGNRKIHLELSEPPPGITLEHANIDSNPMVLLLKADGKLAPAGFRDNLIIKATVDAAPANLDNVTKKTKRQVPLGVLPAIPVEVVPKSHGKV